MNNYWGKEMNRINDSIKKFFEKKYLLSSDFEVKTTSTSTSDSERSPMRCAAGPSPSTIL